MHSTSPPRSSTKYHSEYYDYQLVRMSNCKSCTHRYGRRQSEAILDSDLGEDVFLLIWSRRIIPNIPCGLVRSVKLPHCEGETKVEQYLDPPKCGLLGATSGDVIPLSSAEARHCFVQAYPTSVVGSSSSEARSLMVLSNLLNGERHDESPRKLQTPHSLYGNHH